MSVSIQYQDFDPQDVVKALTKGRTDIGAVASFVGLVRDSAEAQKISAMELEHYPGMTEKALQAILDQANKRWQLQGASIIHRVGKLVPADQIVMVAVAASHRAEAFQACEFIIDYLKTKAPFWKKEYTEKGAHWVEARDKDDIAAKRWRNNR